MTTPGPTHRLDGDAPGPGANEDSASRAPDETDGTDAPMPRRDTAQASPGAPGDTVASPPRAVLRRSIRDVAPGEPPSANHGGSRRVATTAPDTATIEDGLRDRLGLRPLAARLDPTARLWGWVGPLAVTVLAAVMRLVGLNHPSRLIFDETYYVKQAYSLLTLGYEGEWPAKDANSRFVRGDFSDLSTVADYVVHPSVGKWMIAVGLRLFGSDNGAGWRFSAAVVGTISVLILARIATRFFRSPLLGTTAGLLLAIDGVHLTESRTSLLDIFLMFWVLVGFWFVLKDREWSRARLARRAAVELGSDGHLGDPWGPRLGPRWWLVGAGVALGLATGVKWSGLYAVAVFGIMVFVWDACARRAVSRRRWLASGVVRGGVPAFVALVPVAALTYVATWFSWFTHPDAYRRQWAADLRATGEAVPRGWLPDAVNSWWEYHLAMWQFHNNLESEHAYAAHPAGWILQIRPTSFYWPDPAPPPSACGSDRCVQAITSIGNPVIWWLAAAALVVLVYLAVRRRDWRAWAILAGYAAMYLPWFAYAHRTIFTFYSVAFVPYVVLCLTFVLGWAMGVVRLPGDRDEDRANDEDHGHDDAPVPAVTVSARAGDTRGTGGSGGSGGTVDGEDAVSPDGAPGPLEAPAASPSRAALLVSDDGSVTVTRTGWVLYGVVVALAVAVSAFYWPVWTGQTVSYDFWHLHMWLPSWV
ncbi:dolichyl-phosphate-mannose--protein mannosyltransferase [Georgenia sp. SYP-B2076]|uniref:dolichyl-phosphate-mannose--protein mannosyltransferase n=1 Tax=Georgenia sp. SYP-B2076 TaxID=2495881 RepID=UPI000F8ED007|nr:phospholipid carrier-dependent glycosyltransferase [Georgenia sp. SYP-B2076]